MLPDILRELSDWTVNKRSAAAGPFHQPEPQSTTFSLNRSATLEITLTL